MKRWRVRLIPQIRERHSERVKLFRYHWTAYLYAYCNVSPLGVAQIDKLI